MTEPDDNPPKWTLSTFHYGVIAVLIAGAATAISQPRSAEDGLAVFALVLGVFLIRRLLFYAW